jgi:hypothetical protein
MRALADRRPWLRSHPFTDEHLFALSLHLPARNRIKSGCRNSFASRQVEAGVVQRAPDRLSYNESVGKGAMVVSTVGTDGEEAVALAHQHDIVISNLPGDRDSVAEFTHGNARCQIHGH